MAAINHLPYHDQKRLQLQTHKFDIAPPHMVTAYRPRAKVWADGLSDKPDEIKHGSSSGYRKGCRCSECAYAYSKTQQEKRYRERLRRLETPAHLHGTLQAYKNYRCRCKRCVRANREYMTAWRKKQVTG